MTSSGALCRILCQSGLVAEFVPSSIHLRLAKDRVQGIAWFANIIEGGKYHNKIRVHPIFYLLKRDYTLNPNPLTPDAIY